MGEILWSLLIIYLMLMYIVVVITDWTDSFRNDDIGGGNKIDSTVVKQIRARVPS